MHDTSMPPHKSSLIPYCDDHNKAKQEERVPSGGVLHRSRTSARRARICRRHQAASIAPPDARWLGFVAVTSSRKLTPQSPPTPPNCHRQNVVRVRWTEELE